MSYFKGKPFGSTVVAIMLVVHNTRTKVHSFVGTLGYVFPDLFIH